MYLDVFDRRIVDSLRARAMTLAELVRDTGYARSTVIIHLERLRSEGLVLREKKPGERRGRPDSLTALQRQPHPKQLLHQTSSP